MDSRLDRRRGAAPLVLPMPRPTLATPLPALLTLLITLPTLSLAGCRSDPRERLTGKWVTATGSVEFLEDGTVTLAGRGQEPRSGTWELVDGDALRIEAPEPREYGLDLAGDRLRLRGPDGELALQAYRYTEELEDGRLAGTWERADQPGVVLEIAASGAAEIREPDGSVQDHGRASSRGRILFLEMAGGGSGAAVMTWSGDTLRLETVVGPETDTLVLVRRPSADGDEGAPGSGG